MSVQDEDYGPVLLFGAQTRSVGVLSDGACCLQGCNPDQGRRAWNVT